MTTDRSLKLRLIARKIRSLEGSIEHYQRSLALTREDTTGINEAMSREIAQVRRLEAIQSKIEREVWNEIESEFGRKETT